MHQTVEVKQMHFDGPCPFLLCLADCPHDHPICRVCGAVGYGNLFCEECRRNIDIHRELAIIELQANKASE